MKTLGLDIGTTSICAAIFMSGTVIETRTVRNDSFLPGQPWERLQDPEKIAAACQHLLSELLPRHPDTAAIGVTGQMHGIVYLNGSGQAVSPLYTWQDGRGDLPFDDETSWAAHLSQTTGYPLATGYGMVTHYYNLHHSLVPENTAKLCTIQDYIAMKLSGLTAPRIDPTDAASLGLYDLRLGAFDHSALQRAGISPALLPQISPTPLLGTGSLGIPVYTAIGDNQASFLGATGVSTDVLLVNVGTGSQVSVYSREYMQAETLETRPFPDGGWLLVGASLCGGRSYAMLENFFRQTVKMVTGSDDPVYDAMERALDAAGKIENVPQSVTTFQGTRKDPSLRGSITGIGTDNFTPLHFMHSIMGAMAQELYDMYAGYLHKGGTAPCRMIGSGNGLRKNKHLCRIFEEVFGYPLTLSDRDEEAACGAAIYAAKHF